MRHITFAIDPGINAGLALFVDKELVCTKFLKTRPRSYTDKQECILAAINEASLQEVFGESIEERIIQFVVEDQFLGMSFRTVKSIIENSLTWIIAANMLGFREIKQVYPNSWQAMLGMNGKKCTRKWREARTREICHRVFPETEGVKIDICSAVLLGLYFHRDITEEMECFWNPIVAEQKDIILRQKEEL